MSRIRKRLILNKFVENIRKELAEKDAMIDWLADKLSGVCKLGRVCPSDHSDISCPKPHSLCYINSEDWKKAAQEAVKKNEKDAEKF